MPAIKNMGRAEIAKAHSAGLPGVYMIGEKLVWEYPGGEVVGIEEHRRRNAQAMAAQVELPTLATEDEIDELADQLVKEERAVRSDS
ncbi:hypothetical protein U8P76_05660 [Rhizobium johnstonii]|nr:hypothetical protein U8P76_05660 [Rhizobium johnstonii]